MYSLSHICFYTSNLDTMVNFYVRLFKTKIIHKFLNNENIMYGAFIEIGNNTLIEIFNSQIEGKQKETCGFKHFCIETKDINETVKHLKKLSLNVEITRGKSDNTLQCHIEDPDGNKIEFQEIDDKSDLKFFSSFS